MTSLHDCKSIGKFAAAADLAAAPIVPTGGFAPNTIIPHNGADGAIVNGGYTGAAGQVVNTCDRIIYDGSAWRVMTND